MTNNKTAEQAAKPEFQKELVKLLNKFSKDNEANTPDFVLAEYVTNCLKNLCSTLEGRNLFFGKDVPGNQHPQQQAVNPWVKAIRDVVNTCGTINFSSHNQMREAIESTMEICESLLSSQPAPVVDGDLDSEKSTWFQGGQMIHSPKKEEILRDFKSGKSVGEIASIHNRSIDHVWDIVSKDDDPVASTPIDVDEMADEKFNLSEAKRRLSAKQMNLFRFHRKLWVEGATAVLERMRDREGEFAEWLLLKSWRLFDTSTRTWYRRIHDKLIYKSTADLYAQYKKEVGK